MSERGRKKRREQVNEQGKDREREGMMEGEKESQ